MMMIKNLKSKFTSPWIQEYSINTVFKKMWTTKENRQKVVVKKR